MTIGVSELQRNISIIRNLEESLQVVDKKTNEVLATIVPNKRQKRSNLTDALAGALQNEENRLPEHYHGDLERAIKDAYHQAMMEKYGSLNEK